MESFWTLMLPFGNLLEHLPVPHLRKARVSRARLDTIIYGLIAERRASGLDHGDLLSMLLAAQDDEDGRTMTDEQVRDEAMTIFLAGHETTANALAWTWFLLGQNPAAESRLYEELVSTVGDRWPDVNDVPKLVYTEAVLKESMRLYPPAFAFSRRVLADATIGGYHVSAGSAVIMSQWVIHRDERWWDEPEKFLPERWLQSGDNDSLQSRKAEGGSRREAEITTSSIPSDRRPPTSDLSRPRPAYAYFPFGGGPRGCIGNTFAMLEAILVVAAIASRYRIELVAPETVRPWPSVTLRPRGAIQAVLHARTLGRRASEESSTTPALSAPPPASV
jgi:cytochrome P450